MILFLRTHLGESSEKYKMLGLNLLYLLSQNRVAEFHTELELLPVEIIQSDKYICYPLALEQYIMEGRYNKIFAAKVWSVLNFEAILVYCNYFSLFNGPFQFRLIHRLRCIISLLIDWWKLLSMKLPDVLKNLTRQLV